MPWIVGEILFYAFLLYFIDFNSYLVNVGLLSAVIVKQCDVTVPNIT